MIRRMAWLAAIAALVSIGACARQQDRTETDGWTADDSAESVTEVIDGVTTFPTQLDPRIWDGMQMTAPGRRAR